jgi:hypothetical protein
MKIPITLKEKMLLFIDPTTMKSKYMNHREKMLLWINRLGLIVIHTEIKPYGKGTRRYMIGRHTEEPKQGAQLPSGKWQMTKGVQEWLTPEPLNGPDLEAWLKDYENSH